jgi:hypothetical protein
MADNKDEEHLDNSIIPQSENLSEETIPANDTETIHLNQETKNMEVHHHPHHITHKKKWGEYLLEFLMLFLAVFLGFVAENIRENAVEQERAKEYANLLIEDLSADTTQLNTAAQVMNLIIVAGDSLGNILSKNAKLAKGGKLYFYEYLSSRSWNFISHDATFQQLKSSGALRYFRDTSLIRKIMIYEESVQIIYLAQNRFQPQKIENWNLVQKVFDQSYFYSTGDTTEFNLKLNEEKVTRYLSNNYALLTYDLSLIQQIRNWAYSSSTNYKVEIKLLNDAKRKSISAMDALKKEYHLNN